MKLFHGGPAGLSACGFILPPKETKVYSCSDSIKSMGSKAPPNPHRTDKVYLSSLFAAAEMFASMAPHRTVSVYEVEVIGGIEPDPDCDDPTMSFQASKARIIRERRILPARRRRILAVFGLPDFGRFLRDRIEHFQE